MDGPSDEVPLLVAAKNGHDAVVKLLVEHGANPDTQVRHGSKSIMDKGCLGVLLYNIKYTNTPFVHNITLL